MATRPPNRARTRPRSARERDLRTSTIAPRRARASTRSPGGTPPSCRSRSPRRAGSCRLALVIRSTAHVAPPRAARLGLAGQRLALGRGACSLRRFGASGATSASARAGSSRSSREPEREVDERRRDLADHSLDRTRVDPGRRRVDQPRHDPARTRTPERHTDDRADTDTLVDLVGELTSDRTRRHERIDRGKGHPPA